MMVTTTLTRTVENKTYLLMSSKFYIFFSYYLKLSKMFYCLHASTYFCCLPLIYTDHRHHRFNKQSTILLTFQLIRFYSGSNNNSNNKNSDNSNNNIIKNRRNTEEKKSKKKENFFQTNLKFVCMQRCRKKKFFGRCKKRLNDDW